MQPHENTAADPVGVDTVDIEIVESEGSKTESLNTESLNTEGLKTEDIEATVFDLDQDPFIEQVVGNLYKLGLSWQSGGDFASAEVVYLLILELKEMYPDLKSPELVLGCSNLADVLSAVDRNVEAEHYYLEAIKFSVSILGLEHPSTAIGLRNYAEFLRSMNLQTEADDVSKRAQQIFAQSFHRLVATLPNPDGGDPADQAEVLLFGFDRQRLWRGQSNPVRGYNVS
jgi:hypothetical protein